MEDLRAARAPKPEKKENNTIRRKLEILDGAAASGKDLLEFCQDFNKANTSAGINSGRCEFPAKPTTSLIQSSQL